MPNMQTEPGHEEADRPIEGLVALSILVQNATGVPGDCSPERA
jgi:hypothetical protein